tara:strand:- start:990 stop:1673 length:684 start_codon:yes stop_codon:yes gene_type:complete
MILPALQHKFIYSYMNEALIKQVEIAKRKNKDINNQTISDGTGIHKSTVSEHLSSQKRLSIEQAKSYAKYLNVPLIRVIDDSTVKYPIVAYANNIGEVLMRQPHQNEIIVHPNEIRTTGEYGIYNEKWQSIHFYHPNIHSSNLKKLDQDNTNTAISIDNMINDLAYIITKQGQFIGEITKVNLKNYEIEWYSLHTAKTSKATLIKAYPILSVTKTKYALAQKIQQVL